MPRKPASPCGFPGCANLQPCPAHARPAWDGSTRRTETSSTAWRKTAARIRRRDQHRCYLCNKPGHQVDHVTPVAEGGSDDDTNLAVICDPCHATKSAREGHRGRARKARGGVGGRARP